MSNYIRTIYMQIRLMVNRKEFQLAYMINIGYMLLTYVYYVICCFGEEISTIPSSSAVFALQSSSRFFNTYVNIVPFLAALPFAMSFIDDRKNLILPMLQVRSGIKVYYVSKAAACFAGGFFAFFIPMAIGMLLNYMTFPDSGITFIGDCFDVNYDAAITGADVLIETRWAGIWFPELFLEAPNLYNFLYLIFFSTAMGIFSTFIYVASFFVKNQKLLLFLPLFLIVSCFNIADQFSLEHTPYLCYKILPYITVNTMYGKNPMFIYVFFLIMVSLLCVGIHWQIYKDQLD